MLTLAAIFRGIGVKDVNDVSHLDSICFVVVFNFLNLSVYEGRKFTIESDYHW